MNTSEKYNIRKIIADILILILLFTAIIASILLLISSISDFNIPLMLMSLVCLIVAISNIKIEIKELWEYLTKKSI